MYLSNLGTIEIAEIPSLESFISFGANIVNNSGRDHLARLQSEQR